MAQDTIFEKYLAPIFWNLLVDGEALKQFKTSIDWESESDRLTNPTVIYPDYYTSGNFHGIESGYLNIDAAVSYDAVTQYVLPPNETIVRRGLIDTIRGQPRRILDLGCGTGSMTIMLKEAFPDAEVIGLDLSPYMLFCAEVKANQANSNIQWQHGNAKQTGFPDASFDLVTAALLFHETPPAISKAILHESFRLLNFGGQAVILDGNQKTLRQADWLTNIFEEPHIKSYALGNLDAWMGAAGFGAVRTEDWWWTHQITAGVKPLPGQDEDVAGDASEIIADSTQNLSPDADSFPAPAY